MKKRHTPRAMTAVTALLIVSIFGTWLVSMVTLTLVTAQELFDQLYNESVDFTDTAAHFGRFDEFYDESDSLYGYQYERPDYREYAMLNSINKSSASYYTSGRYGGYYAGHSKLIRDIKCPMETAVLFYDGDGNLLHSSMEDVLYFDYYTQEEWDAGRDSTAGLHYGWMDISEGKNAEDWQDDPWLRVRTMYAGDRWLFDLASLRITGYFEGTQLIPVSVYYTTETLAHQAAEGSDAFFTQISETESMISYDGLSQLDRAGLLDWQLQFDRSGEYDGGQELVTVYTGKPTMWDYESSAVTFEGAEYESLAALTEARELDAFPSYTLDAQGKYTLGELIVFGRRTYYDERSVDIENEIYPTAELYLVTAVRCHPLSCALSALRNIYIVTGLLALVLFWVVRGSIKKRLVLPVRGVADAMEDGWSNLYQPDAVPPMWRETAALTAAYDTEKDRRRMKDNEITRLNTALEYAKTAEQNRRQLTSHIAHELKTPIAIIHSYAEGLKEHIAEDKRDKYIDVILSEAERTDAMVLELLDLSRLEAGKVRLARDEFSLTALTRSIFDRLEMATRAKGLQIEFAPSEEVTVTADENRMAQVVENLASNAVKYTPEGGHIRVSIRQERSRVTFRMENDCQPLSEEALRRVWDAFYRADEARDRTGTGLGLAIARQIVELHGGKCSVRNTDTGVEFGFTV